MTERERKQARAETKAKADRLEAARKWQNPVFVPEFGEGLLNCVGERTSTIYFTATGRLMEFNNENIIITVGD